MRKVKMSPRRKAVTTAHKRTAIERREQWVQRYAEHHNATLAAIEVGYSPKSAENMGGRLLRDEELHKRVLSYAQLGLDRLAVIAMTSKNPLAAEKAAEFLVERGYGKARSNDADLLNAKPNIVINLNKIQDDNSGSTVRLDVIDQEAIDANSSNVPETLESGEKIPKAENELKDDIHKVIDRLNLPIESVSEV